MPVGGLSRGCAWACLGLFRAGLLPSVTAIGGFGRRYQSLEAKAEATGAQGLYTCSLRSSGNY